MSLLRDEHGKLSTARCLLWVWSVFCLTLIALHWSEVGQAVLSFLGSVELSLCAIVGGPRALQYIGPQLGSIIGAIGQSKDGSLASTDLSEMRNTNIG